MEIKSSRKVFMNVNEKKKLIKPTTGRKLSRKSYKK
jgi:hypothetical protein